MNHLPILKSSRAIAALLMLAPLTERGFSQEPTDVTPSPSIMHEVSPGVYEMGKLRLTKATHSISFPCTVNMDKGTIEYLLVMPSGNAHESMLVTADVQPRDLHLAMLLLGAKGAGIRGQPPEEAPPTQLSRDYLARAPKLVGDDIAITVTWKAADGTQKTVPVEDWIIKNDSHKPAEHGPWIYNGSMFSTDGKFLAQVEGNFIAMVTNPAALINNPRKGSDNDQIWDVNPKVIPPAHTPVELTLQLLHPEPDTPPKK